MFTRAAMSSGRGSQLFHADPAQLKQPDEGFINQIVRTRSSGRDADDDPPLGQPIPRLDVASYVLIVLPDFLLVDESSGVENELGCQLFFGHLGEVRSVGGVVTTDDEKQVHLHVEQFSQSVLSFLSCAADRVEET